VTRLLVVAAAIVRDGRVLAAQRDQPSALAGKWELPGGKVEPGETEPAALIRECREELDVEVVVHHRIGPDVTTVGRDGVLRGYLATTTGEPASREHRQLRWLGADELDDVEWLAPDGPIVDAIRRHLAPT
jgi:8-oxo-dGTP diphosphatase